MDLPSKDVVSVITALMPGFLAAWIFYGLTAHPRLSAFERVVQALIFTVIIQGLIGTVRWCCLFVGQAYALGPWTADVALNWSLVIATAFGLLLAGLSNNNTIHIFLFTRKWNFRKRKAGEPVTGWVWTRQTAYPGQWYGGFHREMNRYIVLHFKDGRRLYGWPEEWPEQSDKGHFFMSDAEWLIDDGSTIPLTNVSGSLIPATDIDFVEFVKYVEETATAPPPNEGTKDGTISPTTTEGSGTPTDETQRTDSPPAGAAQRDQTARATRPAPPQQSLLGPRADGKKPKRRAR